MAAVKRHTQTLANDRRHVIKAKFNETHDYSRADVESGKLNPNYLSPASFQTPRSVRLTARYEF